MIMRILLICAPNEIPFYATPQLGVFRIAHFLQKAGLECDIFDPTIDEISSWSLEGHIYDIIAVSGNNICMQHCLDLTHHFASSQVERPFLAVGGITPTYNPDYWLDCGFDAVMLGYGEESLTALGLAVQELKRDRNSVLSGISGLAWRPSGDSPTVINQAAPLTKELFNRLTYENMLDIDIPYQKYWDINENIADQLSVDHNAFIVKTVRLFTSSQCPNRCGYCPSKFLTQAQGSLAKRLALEPEQSLELIRKAWERHGCELIFFNDEEFLCDKKTTVELCKLIIEAKRDGVLPNDLFFQCQSRVVDFLEHGRPDQKLLALLAQAGFNRISLGVENLCSRLLATPVMNKAQYSPEDVEEIVTAFQETTIKPHLNFMLLVPETTPAELRQNCQAILKLLKKNVLILLNLYILAAPGAPAVDSGQYELTRKKVISPLNGRVVEIPDLFLLRDPELRTSITRLDGLIEEEMTYYLKSIDSKRDSIATTNRSLVLCLALMKLTEDIDLYNEFAYLLYKDTVRKAPATVRAA
jgi:radical SAM superfamily enzyme YgiQ (UPF0313 family)